MPPNFKTRLQRNERLVGILITLPSPELAEMCADAGMDWLFVDMEHGSLEVADVQRIAQAVGDRCACIVRVPSHDEAWIKKVLDVGVDGLIVPHVNTADQAARVVSRSKYPPQGARSVGVGRAHRYNARFQEYVDRANQDITVIAQAEHIDAVRNIDSILAVKGIDAILVGPYDLSASMNKLGMVSDPEVQQAIARVREACTTKRVPAGIFAGNIDAAKKGLDDGFTLLAAGLDVSLFSATVGQLVKTLRA